MRTHFKERSKRNRVDLTHIGRYEIIAPAIAGKDQWIKEKYPEAVIITPLEDLFVPPPKMTPKEKREMFTRIKIVNLIKGLLP